MISTSETVAHRPLPPNRAAGVALAASGATFFTAEFVAAAAWTDPPYSYTHHFISNLGVHGPTTAFGQFMYSPLAWVMNTGFVLFGLWVAVGALLLKGLPGRLRVPVVVLAVLLAAGGVVLGFFPGSGEVTDSTDFHGLGAFLAFFSGNVLVVLLGRAHRVLGVSRGVGRGLVVAGIAGLVAIPAYLGLLASGAGILIGLVERGIVYPFLISLVVLGTALRRTRVPAPVRAR
ncbi:DUF998 domain-containing protein [Lentzea sp. NPDC060358]|uniref:DUF998 domain-containing protein n=1 Tax=Lentzea sp. NPDC060358 TaxID=3347103 RepID=UPI00365B0624